MPFCVLSFCHSPLYCIPVSLNFVIFYSLPFRIYKTQPSTFASRIKKLMALRGIILVFLLALFQYFIFSLSSILSQSVSLTEKASNHTRNGLRDCLLSPTWTVFFMKCDKMFAIPRTCAYCKKTRNYCSTIEFSCLTKPKTLATPDLVVSGYYSSQLGVFLLLNGWVMHTWFGLIHSPTRYFTSKYLW